MQKVLSQAGIASRRAAEKLIIDGRVEVDGQVVTELGTRVDPDVSVIRVDGARVVVDDSMVYLALNKPRGMHSTMSDDRGRPCIGDLIERRVRGNKNLFHVGRLDADTEGLILLTNDGELAHRLMHPSHEVPKTYLATVTGSVPRGLRSCGRESVGRRHRASTILRWWMRFRKTLVRRPCTKDASASCAACWRPRVTRWRCCAPTSARCWGSSVRALRRDEIGQTKRCGPVSLDIAVAIDGRRARKVFSVSRGLAQALGARYLIPERCTGW